MDRRHPGRRSLIRDRNTLKRLPLCDPGSRFGKRLDDESRRFAGASILAALLVFFAGAAGAGIVAADLSVRAPVTGRALFPNTVECLNPIRRPIQRLLENFLRIEAVFEQLSVDPSVLKKNGEQSEERLRFVFPQVLPRLCRVSACHQEIPEPSRS